MFKMLRSMMILSAAAGALALGGGLLAMGSLGYGPAASKNSGSSAAAAPAAAEEVIAEVVERVADSLPDPQKPQTLLIAPVRGDRDDELLRERLAQAINDSGKYKAVTSTIAEKALTWLALDSSGSNDTLPSDEEARAAAKSANADAVLVADVEKFKQSEPARVKMAWKVVDATGEASMPLVVDRLDHSADEPDPKIANGTSSRRGKSSLPLPVGWALLVWVGTALLVPVALAGGLSSVLSRESNFATGALLIAMTIGDVVLALFLMGWRADGIMDGLIVLTAFGMGGVYNYVVLEKLENIRM